METDENSLGLRLKEFFSYIYPHMRLDVPIKLVEVPERINIVCMVSRLTRDEFVDILTSGKWGFNLERIDERYATISREFTEQQATQRLRCHLMEPFEGVFVFFTTHPKVHIERALLPPIAKVRNVYNLWISPVSFRRIQDMIMQEFPETQIPFFTAIRRPYYKVKSKIRPSDGRTIVYHSGTDGKEMLEELKFYYGMLPRVIQFRIPEVIDFRIDFRGIFTVHSGDMGYVERIIGTIVDTILESKKVVEQSRFEFVKVKMETKEVELPSVVQWAIKLGDPLEYVDVENLIDILGSEHDFAVYDSYAERGSMYWSASVLDSVKDSIFTIKSDGRRIYVLPRYNPSFDSFLRFYHFFVENIDSSAKVEVIGQP